MLDEHNPPTWLSRWPFDVDPETGLRVLYCVELLDAAQDAPTPEDVEAMLVQRFGLTQDKAEAAVMDCVAAGVLGVTRSV